LTCHESASVYHRCNGEDVQSVEVAYDEGGNYAASFEDAHHVNGYELLLCAEQRRYLESAGAPIRIRRTP